MNYRNPYIGNEDQLMSVCESRLCQGRQENVKIIRIDNGGDLSVTIVPDRAMDIYQVRYRGKNMNYIGPCGMVGPEYYNERGAEWLRSFFAGFLTTLGLQHMGSATVVNGDPRGLHGKISSCPAENVTIERGTECGRPTITVRGVMREAKLLSENLRLTRTLRFYYDENRMTMSDEIENYGFTHRQYYLGYHINYGYPLLDEGTQIEIENGGVLPIPRNEHASRFIDSYSEVTLPEIPYPERCYFHNMAADADGLTGYSVFNPKLNIGVRVRYSLSDFPFFNQWKLFRKGEYVCGLEPMCCNMDAPHIGEEGCPAPIIEPGETKKYDISFVFYSK